MAPRAYDSRLAFGRIVRTRWLPPEHVTQVDGFPVTTMARTFFDLCAQPRPRGSGTGILTTSAG